MYRVNYTVFFFFRRSKEFASKKHALAFAQPLASAEVMYFYYINEYNDLTPLVESQPIKRSYEIHEKG